MNRKLLVLTIIAVATTVGGLTLYFGNSGASQATAPVGSAVAVTPHQNTVVGVELAKMRKHYHIE